MPRLYYPVKPWKTTQQWGIYNPAYLQFGFSKHNGIDVQQGDDQTVYCPIQNLHIYFAGWGDSTGWCVKGYTTDDYVFPDGVTAKLDVIVMHGETLLCKTNDFLQPGDKMMISDNTGFSTGPHVHFMCRRLDPKNLQILDTNDANNSIDPAPYFTGYFASDVKTIIAIYQSIISLLSSFLSSRKGN